MFDPASVTAPTTRNQEEYSGVRVKLTATRGTARLTVGMAVTFGDPIWPAPERVELPRVMDHGLLPETLLGCPLTMVLPEKVMTALNRGVADTRWQDCADVCTPSRLRLVEADELCTSIAAIAQYRHVALAALLPGLAPTNERAHPKYSAGRTRARREATLPAAFAELLAAVASPANRAMTSTATGRWNPRLCVWG